MAAILWYTTPRLWHSPRSRSRILETDCSTFQSVSDLSRRYCIWSSRRSFAHRGKCIGHCPMARKASSR
eukprot:3137866-Prymnesium_polylepis.1